MSRAAAGVIRLARAWRSLSHEHRLAAGAAAALFLTLFFPWYQETVVSPRRAASTSVSGWGAFSLVEAVVLIVAAGVLVLLFRRGEGHVSGRPSRDGSLIAAAGLFASVLVVWRIFDKQTVSVRGPGAAISGVEWGIFFALAATAFLAYTGNRIRNPPRAPRRAASPARLPARPPSPSPAADSEEQPTGSFEPVTPPAAARPRSPRRPRRRRYGTEQLTIPLDERDADG